MVKTSDTDKSDYGWRPLLNKSQFEINVIALVSLAIDGYFPRHRLCDALVGQILLARYLGLLSRELAAVFHTMFIGTARLRLIRWYQAGNAGGPFLGPCGLPMRLPKSEKLILLCGSPPRDGISKWTFESIHAALLSGNLDIWYWLIQTLYAGKAPNDLGYTFGSHDISRLPIHYHEDEIGYESQDDSRGWGPGKNPLAKGPPPRGSTRPPKGIYFNLEKSQYFKGGNPREAMQRTLNGDLRQIEIFMSKCFGFGTRNKNAVRDVLERIWEHGNLITRDTAPPFVLTSLGTENASAVSTPVFTKVDGRGLGRCKTFMSKKELYGVVPGSDESEFDESEFDESEVEEVDEIEKKDEEAKGEENEGEGAGEKLEETVYEKTRNATEEETDEEGDWQWQYWNTDGKYYDTPTKSKRAKKRYKFISQRFEENSDSRP